MVLLLCGLYGGHPHLTGQKLVNSPLKGKEVKFLTLLKHYFFFGGGGGRFYVKKAHKKPLSLFSFEEVIFWN